MQDSIVGAFDEVFIAQTLNVIENGDLNELPRFLDTQLSSQLVPEWYKNEIIGRIYERVKEVHRHAKTRMSREKFFKAMELMNHNYGASLHRK